MAHLLSSKKISFEEDELGAYYFQDLVTQHLLGQTIPSNLFESMLTKVGEDLLRYYFGQKIGSPSKKLIKYCFKSIRPQVEYALGTRK